jgi:hypothetical protein
MISETWIDRDCFAEPRPPRLSGSRWRAGRNDSLADFLRNRQYHKIKNQLIGLIFKGDKQNG